MQPALGKNDPNFNRGYEDGFKWGVYDYNGFPGPEYDAGFMAGYFKREGRPFDGETFTQREQARKQAQYQENSWYAQKIFGDANPVTIKTTALLKALAFLVIFTIISSVSSLFDGHKSSDRVNNHVNNNHQQEELVYSESAKKQLSHAPTGRIEEQDEINNNEISDNSTETFNEADFEPYMGELQRRIKMNWDPPKLDASNQVAMVFQIAKDGRLLSYEIQQSSGIQSVDESAVKALKLSVPFKPLPPSYKGDSIDIEFTFDYHKFER